jgi:Na+-driven multidrug efflux pump
MVVNYIFFIKKTHLISIITFSTAALNLVLNYFFITLYGSVGAAKATALCMFIEFVAVWMLANKLYPMPWFKLSLGKP